MKTIEINEELRVSTLDEIRDNGIKGRHLLSLARVLFLKERDCQRILKISPLSWNNVIKDAGDMRDPAIAILVLFYLNHPDEWPEKKKNYDFEAIAKKLKIKESQIPMYVGRSNFALYRWKQSKQPNNHTSAILDIIDRKSSSKSTINNLKAIVLSVANEQGVDVNNDISWSGNIEGDSND